MEKAVAYVRVSSLTQLDGFGLSVQERDVRTCAKSHGVRLVAVFRDEGVSGSLEAVNRPGLADALSAIEVGDASVLLLPRLDRLARKLTIQEAALAQVWKHGGRVIACDQGEIGEDDPDDPMRTALRQMAGVFGQLERAMIVARLRRGRQAKASQGAYAYGSPPFGLRAEGGELVPEPREQEAVALALVLRKQGLSLREIGEALAGAGHMAKRGASWHPTSVARLLSRATT